MKYVKHGKHAKDNLNKVIAYNKKNEKVTYLLSDEAKKQLDEKQLVEGDEFFNNVDRDDNGIDKSTTPLTILSIIFPKEVVKSEKETETATLDKKDLEKILVDLKEIENRVKSIIKVL